MSRASATRLLLLAACAAAFAPALSAGFSGWDDPAYVTGNPLLERLDLAHLREMLASTLGGVRIPLTWLSLALDRALWGPGPFGYHLTNLLLHMLGALLAFEVLRAVFGRLGLKAAEPAAALGALFFALHPLQVESVAWVSERKGVLAGALWLGALLARLRSREGREAGWQAASVALFGLSLAAKPNGLSFPLVLCALEAGVLGLRPALSSYAGYLALSGGAFLLTLSAGSVTNAIGRSHPASVAWTLGQALYGLLFYPLKALWPAGLSVYYPPRPWFGSWSAPLFGHAAALAAAVWGARRLGGRRGLALLAAYALALLPMLGLVSHGVAHAAADRFGYLPLLALAAVFGAALARRPATLALAAVWLLALGAASHARSRDWRDPLTLWTAAARAQPCAYTLANQGALLARARRFEEAVGPLRASIALDARESIPHEALGASLAALGRAAEARAAWRAGLEAAPSPSLRGRLGAWLCAGPPEGRAEGLALLRQAAQEQPQNAAWRAELGDALARAGRGAEALAQYRSAIALDPDLGAARVSLGNLLARAGRLEEAAAQYRLVKEEDRASKEARSNLAAVEAALRRR